MKEIKKSEAETLYYDGTCAFCVRWVERLRGLLARRGVVAAPFVDGAAEPEMRLRRADGSVHGGADAVFALAERIWWARPFAWAGRLGVVRRAGRHAYRAVARRRHCGNGACGLSPARRPRGIAFAWWALATGATGIAVAASAGLPAWGRMWVIAAVFFFGFKASALARVRPALGWRRVAVFLFLWPAMDAEAFVARGEGRAVNVREVAGPLLFVLAGCGTIWGAARFAPGAVSAGWCGMTGLVCLLHFGVFALLAVFWRGRGFAVRGIMDAPWKAETLAEFWGARWNRAFSEVARVALFRPLGRRLGVAAGTFVAFLFSGIAHELVISVPAGGGYGLPTAFFALQGLGIIAERKLAPALRRPKGEGRVAERRRAKLRGRWFVWAVVLAPAGMLFHPVFMAEVMAPFLEAVGGR